MKWWLREARLPQPRRREARAERWREMAENVVDPDQCLEEKATAIAEGQHSRGADFHRN